LRVRDAGNELHIDITRLNGQHDWNTGRNTRMERTRFVVDNQEPRPDMERFAHLEQEEGEQQARNQWSDFVQAHTYFEIPDTLHCDRTFVREAYEAYYLEAMQQF